MKYYFLNEIIIIFKREVLFLFLFYMFEFKKKINNLITYNNITIRYKHV